MKVLSRELEARLRMPNRGGCELVTELIAVHGEDLRLREDEMAAGSISGGGTPELEVWPDGAVRLKASDVAVISNTTGSDDLDSTDVKEGPFNLSVDTPVVAWELSDAIGSEPMLRNVKVFVSRRQNGANAMFDGTFALQLYHPSVIGTVAGEERWLLSPLCKAMYYPAPLMSADDALITFQLDVTGNRADAPASFPIAERSRPLNFNGSGPLGRTIVAHLYTVGGSNSNYSWRYDAAGANEQATAGAGTLYHKTVHFPTNTGLSIGTKTGAAVAEHAGASDVAVTAGTGMPRITFTIGSYPASGTITFTDVNLGAAPSGTIEFVVVKEAPAGTTLVTEVSDDGGANWVPFVDGNSPAALSGISAQQTYQLRATLSSNASQDVTPVLRVLGARDLEFQDYTREATWSDEHEDVDVLNGNTRMADTHLHIALMGVRDYEGVEGFLAENNPTQMQVRRFIGHPALDREHWLLDSLWDVMEFEIRSTEAVLGLVSILNRARMRVPRAIGPVYGYLLKQEDSNLTGGADFTKVISLTAEAADTLTVSVAASATELSYAITPATVPDFAQLPDGDWTQKVKVTAANSNIFLKIKLQRINSSGVMQQETVYTQESQLSSTSVFTFSFLNTQWQVGAASDRIRVVYAFRNANAGGSESVEIETGTIDTELRTPWTAQFQAQPNSYDLVTIADAFEDVRDGLIGLPERYRGNLPSNTTDRVSKAVFSMDGLDLLCQLAFLDGGFVFASQGVLKVGNLHKPRGVTVAGWSMEELSIDSISQGIRQRVPEFYVPCRFDGAKFGTEVYVHHAQALPAFGRPTLNPGSERLDNEIAKWIPSETLAARVGKWIVSTHGLGQMMARGVRVTYAYPELELGDAVAFETDRLAIFDPVTESGLHGRMWVYGVIVGRDGPWGTRFDIWIPSPADLYASSQTAHRRDPYEAIRIGLVERPAANRLSVARVVLQASVSGATIKYYHRTAAESSLDFGDHHWEAYDGGILELARDQSAVTYLDVYATSNNMNTSRLWTFPIQPDTTATIAQLSGSLTGTDVTAVASGVDGDTRWIRWYAQKHAADYPTADGTATGQPLESCFVAETDVQQAGGLQATHAGTYAASDHSRWIAVPIDYNRNWGTRKALDYTVPASDTHLIDSISWSLDNAGFYPTTDREYGFAWSSASITDADVLHLYIVINGSRVLIHTENDPSTNSSAAGIAVDGLFPRTGYPDMLIGFEYELVSGGIIVDANTILPADQFQGSYIPTA